MNIIKLQSGSRYQRKGISLVEVLTSIVVAVIGVAGVLILIPFGIRQAEIGLDLDDSIAMADNAYARFEIEGYRRVNRDGYLPWINIDDDPYNDPTPDPQCAPFLPVMQGQSLININCPTDTFYIIDPLWTSANTVGGAFFPDPGLTPSFYTSTFVDQLSFPAQVTSLLPEFVALLDSKNPLDPSGFFNALPLGLSARMFLTNDDLQFASENDPISGAELDRLSPPQPYVDLNGAAPLRRQARGEISWSIMALPNKVIDGGQNEHELKSFEFYILVYKDRSFANPVDYANGVLTDSEFDPRYRLATIDSSQTALRYPNNTFRAGGAVPVEAQVEVKSNDWVMMANVNPDTGIYQAGFYRVIGSNPDAMPPTISLDGPSFVFDDPMDASTATIIIHLTSVVNVYRRTISLERDSIFNGG